MCSVVSRQEKCWFTGRGCWSGTPWYAWQCEAGADISEVSQNLFIMVSTPTSFCWTLFIVTWYNTPVQAHHGRHSWENGESWPSLHLRSRGWTDRGRKRCLQWSTIWYRYKNHFAWISTVWLTCWIVATCYWNSMTTLLFSGNVCSKQIIHKLFQDFTKTTKLMRLKSWCPPVFHFWYLIVFSWRSRIVLYPAVRKKRLRKRNIDPCLTLLKYCNSFTCHD